MALDLSDDEELGEFIYRTSHTAKLLREKKEEKEDKEYDKKKASIQEDNMDIQSTIKKRRYSGKRKREVEESSVSVKKNARIECSVQGCNRKAADSGTCGAKHNGYNHCSQDGCTNKAQKGGVCVRHGAKTVRKTCKHDGCISLARKGGVCTKHGAVVKTCSHDGCTKQAKKGGVCCRHKEFAIGRR